MKPIFLLMAALFFMTACASKSAPSADPPSGTWSGDFGPDAERREQVRLDLTWEDSKLRGLVRAGFRELPVSKVSFKPDTGTITLEFDAQGNNGQTVHYVIEGTVRGDAMTGSWSHDGLRGDFRLRKQ
jgi:hypothetical protein